MEEIRRPDLSVIVPAYYEGKLVHTAYARIAEALDPTGWSYECIFVDDGSQDSTFQELLALSAAQPKVKVVKLASNVGSHLAVRCGLDHANGEAITAIACDMQEPPELIVKMYKELKAPAEIVLAVRQSRKDAWTTVIMSNLFYFIARKIAKMKLPPSGTSMFLISRKTLEAIKLYRERNMPVDGLLTTIGFQSALVYYERQERIEGVSKWTLGKKLKLFVDYFVAHSYFPIRFISLTGILFALFGFAWTLYIILREVFIGDLESGWPALISILLVGFGITNISLGIMAEYLWRTLDETRARPKYIVEKTINM